jgi:hypothetical protein
MAKKPYSETKDGSPVMVAAAAAGYQLGWSGGRWVVIRGNVGSQCQTQAESQALADQLNSIVGFASKSGRKV